MIARVKPLRRPRSSSVPSRLTAWLGIPTLALSVGCGDETDDVSGATGAGGSATSTSSAGGATSTSVSGSGGGGGSGVGGQQAGYPAGPYGNEVGETIAYFEMDGYHNPAADALATSGTFGDLSMLDIKQSGSPFVLLHLAAMF